VIALTFRYAFNAAHRMANPRFDEAWNRRTYGKCARASGHGHGYLLEVTLEGRVNAERPEILPRSAVKWLKEEVLAPRLAYTDLEEAFGPGFVSSGENLSVACWNLVESALRERYPEVRLLRVRLLETRKNGFQYGGGRPLDPEELW
jgi:6-pyruvoyltetrahydropterin/6-carboxytetrahydropterin synthase